MVNWCCAAGSPWWNAGPNLVPIMFQNKHYKVLVKWRTLYNASGIEVCDDNREIKSIDKKSIHELLY